MRTDTPVSAYQVLIVGGGGREHALAWALKASRRVTGLFVAPGNAGTASLAQNLQLEADDVLGIVLYCLEHHIKFVVVGPEVPLALGLVDALGKVGVRAFGPSQAAAQLEASKAFAKQAMRDFKIPTADFAVFNQLEAALEYLHSAPFPSPGFVVKADGLAAGKGVTVCDTPLEAEQALRACFGGAFGEAGQTVVIEERLQGKELSLLAFCDGKVVLPMLPARDHKRALDGDLGPNTGGMGAFAPAPDVNAALIAEIQKTVLEPLIKGMAARGTPYKGVLYAGLMLTDAGIRVIEFNCRFGDPEAQVILPLLETDLFDILDACYSGTLGAYELRWKPEVCATVVIASGGYPEHYQTGYPISGLEAVPEGVTVFHAGTRLEDGQAVTSGGRVLNVTAAAETLELALEKAYAGVKAIEFTDMHYRRDIGRSTLEAEGGAQRAESREQRAESRELRAESRAQSAEAVVSEAQALVLEQPVVVPAPELAKPPLELSQEPPPAFSSAQMASLGVTLVDAEPFVIDLEPATATPELVAFALQPMTENLSNLEPSVNAEQSGESAAIESPQPSALDPQATAYAMAGVNIAEGARAVDFIKDAVKSTHDHRVLAGIGAFGGMLDVSHLKYLERPVIVASTDGVGTKTMVAAALNKFDGIGVDIVNHGINDILAQGARPLFFMDYVAASTLHAEWVAEVVSSMARACKAAGCVLLGGETAEMPGVYRAGESDVVGTMVGVVDFAKAITGARVAVGDTLIAFPSNGLHTNGYSLARATLAELDWQEPRPELNGQSIGAALLKPHRSYLSHVTALLKAEVDVRALAHITGGGLWDNLPRALPESVTAAIKRGSWKTAPIFQFITARAGISKHEAFHTFNMGLGMIAVIPTSHLQHALEALPHDCSVIGEIRAFDGQRVVLE